MWQVKTPQCSARPCPRGHGLAVFVLAALSTTPSPANAELKPLAAEVVWARGDRAHVASTDSLPVEVGDLLDFQVRGKTVAAGSVTVIHEAGLATARITSGTLDRVKKLRDIRIRTEPAPLLRLSTMRVAVPASNRDCLLIRRPTDPPDPWPVPRGYRSGPVTKTAISHVRIDSIPLGPNWPDTILIFPFDDPTDQEIALERGEVDLAIFWPGELSRHARRQERWRGFLYGAWQRGVLAGLDHTDRRRGASPAGNTQGSVATRADSALAIMNQEVFLGDLLRVGSDEPRGVRYGVDSFIPGWEAMMRSLRRSLEHAEGSSPSPMTLVYLDSQAEPPESLRVAAIRLQNAVSNALLHGLPKRADPALVIPLFRIRCPIVAETPVRRLIQALGPNAVASFIECRPYYGLKYK